MLEVPNDIIPVGKKERLIVCMFEFLRETEKIKHEVNERLYPKPQANPTKLGLGLESIWTFVVSKCEEFHFKYNLSSSGI
jgi:hypothetical protein